MDNRKLGSRKLLDAILPLGGEIDVQKLDEVVWKYNYYNDVQAQKILIEFRSDLRVWKNVPIILHKAKEKETKILAIDILIDTITTQWRSLSPKDQQYLRLSTHKQITRYIRNDRKSPLLKRMNLVLVAIAKQEWPSNWSSIIHEVVSSARNSDLICENHMNIIKILAQDIFQFQKGLAGSQLRIRQKQILKEFDLIFKLIIQVLDKSKTKSLLQETLSCLTVLLPWLPRRLIFTTPLTQCLVSKILEGNNGWDLKNDVFSCLNEIVLMCSPEYEQYIHQVFDNVLQVTHRTLPPSQLSGEEPMFVSKFILFLKLFLSNHRHLRGVEPRKEIVTLANEYMLKASYIKDRQLFKTCMEYWNYLVKDLRFHELRDTPFPPGIQPDLFAHELRDTAFPPGFRPDYFAPSKFSPSQRKELYGSVLEELRMILVTKMAKPKEVKIMEERDENREAPKLLQDDVDSGQLYEEMKSIIRTLTQLDSQKMMNLIKDRLKAWKVFGRANGFCKGDFDSLIWAAGAVSGMMRKGMEQMFFISVIKELIGFVNLNKNCLDMRNKRCIASGIMHVVQKYPQFLIKHWKFLRAVLMKLFEFMHVSFSGVQEMACETFLIVSKETKNQFVKLQHQQFHPFVLDIVANIGRITYHLAREHLQIFYEALGIVVDQVPPRYIKEVFKMFMEIPNKLWEETIGPSRLQSVQFPATLSLRASDNFIDSIHPKTKEIMLKGVIIDRINYLLKMNATIAKSCPSGYIFQMEHIFGDLLKVYQFYSIHLSWLIREKGCGVSCLSLSGTKKMREIKSGVLKTLENFVRHSDEIYKLGVMKNFVSPFLTMILEDFCATVPIARDATTFALLAACVGKYHDVNSLLHVLPSILETVLSSTLPLFMMDQQNNFADHRTNFYRLLKAVNEHCFQTFFEISENGLRVVMKSILWAIKRREPSYYENGLIFLLQMIWNIEDLKSQKIADTFFGEYYNVIFHDVFHVFSDSFHTTTVHIQGEILRRLFVVVRCYVVKIPLRSGSNSTYYDNKLYLQDYFTKILNQKFRYLMKQQIDTFIKKCFEFCTNDERFMKHLKDFLVDCTYRLKKEKESVLEAVTKNVVAIQQAREELQNDKSFILEVVKANCWALVYVNDRMKDVVEIVIEAVRALVKSNFEKLRGFRMKEYQTSRELILDIARINGTIALSFASSRLRNDKEVVLVSIRSTTKCILMYVSKVLRNDSDVALEAVRRNGISCLKYVSEELRNNKEVTIEALKSTKNSSILGGDKDFFGLLGEKLKMDKDVLLAAANPLIDRISWKIPLVSWNLPEVNRTLFLKLVEMDGRIIVDAEESIRNNLEIVLLAFGRRRNNLSVSWKRYIPNYESRFREGIRREVEYGLKQCNALKFVKKYPMKMRMLFAKNRNDEEVVMEAFRQKRKSIKYAGDKLVQQHPILRILRKNEGDIERTFEIYSRSTPISEQKRLNEKWEKLLEEELKKGEGLRILFRREKLEASKEKEDIKRLRKRLENARFQDLDVVRFLGGGAYGRAYLCHVKGILYRTFVVKFYLPGIAKSEEKVEDILNRDCLDLEFHKNVVFSHLNNGILEGKGSKSSYIENIKNLPDYEEFWEKKRTGMLQFIGKTTKTPIIIMNYHRINMDSYFKQRTKFYPYEIARMISGIISGGRHLHRNKIVHRDLHSRNIFVDPKYGRIWIGDFGCSLDLRKNDTGFLVHKKHERLFSFTFIFSGGKIKKYERELLGGYAGSLAPEINPAKLKESDYLNYEKSDVYSIGVIGMWLLKKIECRKHRKIEVGLLEKFHSFFERLIKEDVDERLGFEGAFVEVNKISRIAVDS